MRQQRVHERVVAGVEAPPHRRRRATDQGLGLQVQRAGDDLLVGALAALGNIGETINAPDAITTATSGASGGTTSSSTTTTVRTGDNDDVVAAALDGFFSPLSRRVSARLTRNRDARNPYLIVEAGRDVSVFVNGVLEVTR